MNLFQQVMRLQFMQPLTPETDNLFDKDVLSRMKKHSYLVNTARGKIVNRDALVEALASEHLQGYAGDVCIHNLHLLIIHGEQCLEML